jgi:hypothetical protein
MQETLDRHIHVREIGLQDFRCNAANQTLSTVLANVFRE